MQKLVIFDTSKKFFGITYIELNIFWHIINSYHFILYIYVYIYIYITIYIG